MRKIRRLMALSGALALLVGAGCAEEADQADDGPDEVETDTQEGVEESGGFEASTGFLSKLVDDTDNQSYRYSMTMEMSMGGQSIDFGGPIATGEYQDGRQYMRMDMGAMFEGIMGSMGGSGGEALPPGMTGDDMVIEYLVDAETMYMRAPFFATMFGSMPPGTDLGEAGGLVEAFGALGDGWGKIDIAALGDVAPGEAAGALGGGQSFDPSIFLDMIRDAEGVEELGTDEIDGEQVTGLAAEVSMVDMLEVQGLSPEDLGPGTEGMSDLTFPLEVWVDGDEQLRRINFTFDEEAFGDIAESQGEDPGEIAEMGGVGMTMSMDFSDWGDDSISVEAPTSDVVDITDDFVQGYEAMEDLSVDPEDLTSS